MGRFESNRLATEKNLSALADLSGQWIDRAQACRSPRSIELDLDSSVSSNHGEQEMSVWNGHFECTCYHPLFAFNQFGDLERRALRPGNVHGADGWKGVLAPVVACYHGRVSRLCLRADAGFANPEVYAFLEAERISYAIRFPANRILQGRIGYLLTRPVGRPPHEVRLQLHALAYNLGNFLRTLATPEPIMDWSLTSLKEKLIKIGAEIISHGRYVAFQMAEVAIPRHLFADILRLIAELRRPSDPLGA